MRRHAKAMSAALGLSILLGALFASSALAAAVIESTRAVDVGLEEATLEARINPGGTATTYHLEYGTDTSYGTSTPEAAIGAESVGQTVTDTLSGLSPATTYHWRVVATSPGGGAVSPDRTFTTYAPSPAPETDCPNQAFRTGPGADLPNCRAYEQATAVDKHGANAEGTYTLVEASVAGDRVTFAAFGGQPSSGGSSRPYPFVASRGSAAWSTNGFLPLTDPGFAVSLAGWSDDLSVSISSGGSNSGEAIYLGDTAAGTWQAIPSSVFLGELYPADFAADPSHLTFESSRPLAPGAVDGLQNLYDLDHGALTLAGQVPTFPATTCDDVNGPACVAPAGGSFAGPYHWLESNLNRGGAESGFYTQNTISADGSKVFFTEGGTGRLYMREDGVATTQISASQAATADPNGPKPAAFVGATPSGSKVFFTSCEQLTDDSTAVSIAGSACDHSAGQGSDLYSYDTGSGELADLTVDSNVGDPLGADVVGFVGASEDGSDSYFVANGVLAPGAAPGDCGITLVPQDATCNLYLAHEGTITYVTSLTANASSLGFDARNWQPVQGEYPKTSRVAADGTLLFSSDLQLTAYDNAGSGELYRYQPGDAAPTCVSCNPTGVPPTGDAELVTKRGFFISVPRLSFLTRNISPDGNRIFFDSPDPLVVADVNGVNDVYEWEAEGSGSCRTAPGCLYLLSTGTSPDPSYFADASASGEDAFFFTFQPLVPQDEDGLSDVYDARVGGGLASQHPSSQPPCQGEACRGAGTSPPPAAGGGSATFQGPGNQVSKPHKKRHHKKRHAKKRHHKGSDKAAGHKRGGGK